MSNKSKIYDNTKNNNLENIQHTSKYTNLDDFTKNNTSLREKISVISFLLIIITQLITKKIEIKTPADVLDDISLYTWDNFNNLGNKIVNVSHTITNYINIKDIAFAFYDIVRPIIILLVSPYNIFTGIIEGINNNTKETYFAVLSTLLLLFIIIVISQRNLWNKFKPINIINYTHNIIIIFYRFIGEYFISLTAIYKVLMLDKFIIDSFNILNRVCSCILAPLIFFKSCNTLYYKKNKHIYLFGGFTILIIFCYGFYLENY